MKTIFDKANRDELISRIHTIDKNSVAAWGKMNVYQMVKHCTVWETWILGVNKPVYKQEFIGFIFGKMALKRMIKDDRPFSKNVPTSTAFKIKEQHGDIAAEKLKWIALIQQYENYSNPTFIHDFFGKMTKEQVGILAYKHTDHHLRQFNS
ncbi:DUF1569 domain-containing protein [Chitinophaga defluvii]|uniref:DUF1569 domain-containing protein n=1 Tax=Chitinophaga defluvii TaxID=3163343 RepID=A0ABV2T7H2_9BACT